MICHKYKIVFVHIPKCAGSSINNYYFKKIDDLTAQAPKGTHTYKHAGPVHGLLNGGLISSRKRHGYIKKCSWLKRIWDTYYKITVVRNPYDRFISGLKHAEKQHPGIFFDDKDQLKKTTLNTLNKIERLRSSIKFVGINWFKWTQYYRYPTWFRHIHFPQYPLIYSDGELKIDDCIRFENLSEEFEKVLIDRKMPLLELPKKNTAGKRKPYFDYLHRHPDIIQWIHSKMEKDFDLLGYVREFNM